MIISLNWLKKFTKIDMSIDDLATLIGARLVEIEEIIDLGAKYKDVIIAKVVEVYKLEGSDHLSVTKIDDGGVRQSVERDENGYIQVVCGASNVRADQLIAWLPPESIVPDTHSDAEPFVLGARKLRGVMSNGMIASARELDLFDEHDGILEIDKDVAPGALFMDAYELDDYLLDIENKSLTHRPDTFGIIGFAREVAAISGSAFNTPDWLANTNPEFGSVEGASLPITVSIDDPALSSRYQAVVLGGADGSSASPLEVQTYLARVGVRPISAVVDVTNYLMMLTGQPLHAFDYDKVVSVGGGQADIHVRAGRDGETLGLLDGRTISLSSEDIVIAAGETAIGLAGAMGGASTVIDGSTKNIIVESATFNLYNLRATQMRHGIFSEAITRFTKGQPAELTAPVLADAVRLLNEWAGAKQMSDVAEAYPQVHESEVINVTAEFINNTLGTTFTATYIVDTLKRVEFSAVESADTIEIKAPYWRADIHIAEDIVEEIGRLNGYDTINPVLPTRDFTAVKPNAFDDFRAKLRSILVRSGSNEVLTYSFIHGDIIEKSHQKLSDSYRITNSISPDLQYYRQSLTPSLLQLVHPNIKNGFDTFSLFEMNKVHPKQQGMTDELVPNEADGLAFAIAAKKGFDGAPYYQAKSVLEYVGSSLGLELKYTPLDKDIEYPTAAPFEYRRSAAVVDVKTGEPIGMVGEYKKSIAKSFKLPSAIAGFELDLHAMFKAVQAADNNYKPSSRYPSTERDICFQVASDVTYSNVIDATKASLSGLEVQTDVSPVDIYQPDDEQFKNVTIRIKLTSHDHTLTGDEVSAVIDGVIRDVVNRTDARVV